MHACQAVGVSDKQRNQFGQHIFGQLRRFTAEAQSNFEQDRSKDKVLKFVEECGFSSEMSMDQLLQEHVDKAMLFV